MALSFSTGYRNARMRDVSFQEMFQGGEFQIWSGTAPSVDAVASGTRLVSVTLSSGARTAETQATAVVELTGGAAGSVDTLTIDGYEVMGAAVAFNVSLTQTAADVASQINKYAGSPIKIYATSSAAVITLRACPGQGTGLNSKAIVCTCTTITNAINGVSADNMGEGAGGSTAGVASANGLTWAEVASGVLSKTGTWSGVVDNSGTAGYWRIEGCNTPTDTSPVHSATAPAYRIQGTCGTTGADHNMGSTTLTAAQTYTVDTFDVTEPAS